ncbi:hypothetical protein EKL99_01165 [Flavobacterium sp. ZB4P23]|uniref:beta strand repeat-containing protein n=1 Tax=Flavobacterium sp. ZB4P23 TaxID=2497484 RepID=UPI000F84DE8B|nr:hypothetical protein [Flavobacterium sp. ZB4P23]RTY84635.1 hypothetical protein EKL99_01165 [Flavobacterium sp. ZB4P23]
MYSKITKIGLFFLFICCCINNASAQTVQKIGGTPFNVTKSAVFELESTTKGFLPPRMTTLQRNGIITPAVGLTIFNIDTIALEINTGTTLQPVWSSVKGYLPLAGGTMTGAVGVNGATLTLNTDTAVANTNTTTIGGGLGTGTITLGGTATQAINIGTGATGTSVKTVTVGSTVNSSDTTIQSGTGALNLTPAATGSIVIGNAAGYGEVSLGSSSNTHVTSVGAATSAGVSTVNIATGGTGNNKVNIATSSAENLVTIGSSASQVGVGGTPVTYAALAVTSTTKGFLPPRMNSGERDILGGTLTKLVDKGMVIFNTTNNALEVNTGTPGAPAWTGLSNSYLPLAGGTMTSTAVIQGSALKLNDGTTGNLVNTTDIGIGGTTGTITLGGTATQAINIGTGATGTNVKTVTIGSTVGASATTIQSGTGTLGLKPTGTGSIVIGNAAGTGDITLGSSSNTQETHIGVGTATGIAKVFIGSSRGGGTGGSDVNIGNIATNVSTYPSTVRIASGAGINTVLLGGFSESSTTTIQSGTGTLSLTPAETGPILIGNPAGTGLGTITLGSSTAAQTTNIGTGTGISTVKIATGSDTNANLVTIGGGLSQVGVGGAPVTYAALAVTSTTKGFLPPRMNSGERDILGGTLTKLVDKGMVIFNTTNNALEVNTGTPGAPAWTGLSNSYLPLAGGTMTGTLGISGTALNLNNNASTNATTIGGGSTSGAITLGGTGTQIINIGTGTGTKTVSLGSDASTSATTIKSGSAALTLTPAADLAGTIVIGNAAGLGPITLGSSTAAQTTNIGTGTGVSTVNVGTGGTGANLVTLGSTTSQVSIGGISSSTTAALDINSTTKGFLPPRLTALQLTTLNSTLPASGLTIYNTDNSALEVNIGTPAVPVWKSATSNPSIRIQTLSTPQLTSADSTVLFDTTSASLTATLPTVTTALTGKIFFIRKDDNSTNTLTISPALKLSGVTTTVVLNYAKTIKVQCDGTNWIIID